MVGQENFIKMKTRPISKEFINKLDLRVEDILIPPNAKYGFKGYLVRDVLVPYINNKRIGEYYFYLRERKKTPDFYELRYVVTNQDKLLQGDSSWHCIRFNRVAYIKLNKHDPRVIETDNYYDIKKGFMVDHDKDIELEKGKFIIKPDTKKNLQLLTRSENADKAVKRINNIPRHIHFNKGNASWCFEVKKTEANPSFQRKTFPILKYGWEGSYIKVIDWCNETTGSNHIPDLNEAIPKKFKGMTEREFVDKYYNGGTKFYKKKKQMNSDDQLDLGLSLA